MSQSSGVLRLSNLSRTDFVGLKSFELDGVVMGPAAKKREHAQASAFYRPHFRELHHNDSRVALRGDRIAQSESRVAPNNSAVAFNDRHFTYFLDMQKA